MGLFQLVRVEFIPDVEGLIEVWIVLFGTGEDAVMAQLCHNYWDYDWKVTTACRVIFDVASSWFPVHFRPLVHLLHASSGTGSLESSFVAAGDESRQRCGAYVPAHMDMSPPPSGTGPATPKPREHGSHSPSHHAPPWTHHRCPPTRPPHPETCPRNGTRHLRLATPSPVVPAILECPPAPQEPKKRGVPPFHAPQRGL